jgi:hypothetical protein
MNYACQMLRVGAVSFIALTAIGLPASAQTSGPAPSAAPRFVAIQAPGEINVGDWIGTPVVNASSEVVGNINYLLVDKAGQIRTVAVGVGGFLGLGEKNVALPFPAFTVVHEANGRQFRVAVTRAELESAPKFEWKTPPLAVRIEDNVKSAAGKVTEGAKDLTKRATDAMK